MKPLASSPQNLRIEMKNHLLPFITSLGTAFSSLPECPEGHLVNLLPPPSLTRPYFSGTIMHQMHLHTSV